MYPTTGIDEKACWKTLGSVMKMSDGPESGLTPTLKAAGKIISPARTATKESMMPICMAVLPRLVWRLKYEAKVQMQPMPMLSE